MTVVPTEVVLTSKSKPTSEVAIGRGGICAADVDAILVTDPEGRLLGLLDRHHAEEHHAAERTG